MVAMAKNMLLLAEDLKDHFYILIFGTGILGIFIHNLGEGGN
jgi:hypothetical protein